MVNRMCMNSIIVFGVLYLICTSNIIAKPLSETEENNLKEFEIEQKRIIEEEYSCQGLVAETDEETELLKKKCLAMMDTPLMKNMKNILLKSTGHDLKKARDQYTSRHNENSRQKRTIVFENRCPIFTENYLSRPGLTFGEKSISPYKAVEDYQENRFPKYVTQHKCLCKGCINIATRREDLRFSSEEVALENVVVFTRQGGNWVNQHVTITVGCTCVAPKMA